MSHYFRISLSLKHGPRSRQLFLQLPEVFNDAVVHDHHVPCRMRVRIGLRGSTMRGPARMANSGHTHHGGFAQTLFKVAQFARRTATFNSPIFEGCNTG